MLETLLQTKLHVPSLRSDLVPRPRLIEQLDRSLRSGQRITLISAPAGFGKTTLASSWVTQHEAACAWLALDKDDNDPIQFLIYLIAALLRPEETSEAFANRALRMLQSSAPPPPEVVLTALINELAGLPSRIILVLDDYHLIDSPAVDDALNFLLENMPPQLHLVIATRVDPQLPLARLRARGLLSELRAQDLRFSSSEAAEFLNQSMGLNISAKDRSVLEDRTEGWIAGLQMAAIGIRGQEKTTDPAPTFSGTHRYILDYLIEEVLDQQSTELQTFLLRTALVDRLCAPLCNALTGRADGQATLEYLEQANLFTVPLDGERRWYRYHHLFADLLRRRLLRTQSDQLPTLHLKASQWFEQNGFFAEAIEQALSADNPQRAARLIEDRVDSIRRQGELSSLHRWLEMLPEELLYARPYLAIYWARYQCAAGHPAVAEQTLKRAEQALEPLCRSGSAAGTQQAAAFTEIDRLKLLGRIAAARALICSYQGDIAGIFSFGQQALDYLPEEDPTWRSATALVLGNAHGFRGDMPASYKARCEALKACIAADDIYYIIVANLEVAITLREQGRLAQTITICEQQLLNTAESGLAQTRLAGWLLAIWGETLAELDDLDQARERSREGFTITLRSKDLQMIGWSFMCLIRVLISGGDLHEAEEVLQKMETFARETQIPPWVAGQMAAWQARLWLAQGKLHAASQWMAERGFTAQGKLNPPREFDFFSLFDFVVLARVLIAARRLDEAQKLLAELLQAAEAGGRISKAIEIKILQALASHAAGQTAEALMALEQALALAEPDGFVRIFIDEGQPMAELLQLAVNRGHAQNYAQQLLAAARSDIPPPTSSAEDQPGLLEPLSERELEVLQLIAAGLTNQEIASRLFLALNTVKVHTRNIYSKLAVHTRTQAVAKARTIGLLPPT